jgi:ankyrin repeat protein
MADVTLPDALRIASIQERFSLSAGTSPSDLSTALHCCVKNRLIDDVKFLLETAECTPDALVESLKHDNSEIAQLLVDSGTVDINAQPGSVPVHFRVMLKFPHMTGSLISAGADIFATDTFRRTALYYILQAVMNGNTNRPAYPGFSTAVRELIRAGADVDIKMVHGRSTALVRVCEMFHEHEEDTVDHDRKHQSQLTATALVLIEEGASLESTNRDGNTPLILACSGDNMQVVKELLAHGANLDACNKYGRSAKYYNSELVKALLE